MTTVTLARAVHRTNVAVALVVCAGGVTPTVLLAAAEPEFKVVTIAEGLEDPWAIAALPNGDVLVTEKAGLVKAKISGEPYHVVPGDVLELTMPAILQAVTDEQSGILDQIKSYPLRISENGTINLSIIGEIKAAGKTLSQIESAVIDAYYPEYTVTRPSVFVRVLEYKTARVSITNN